MVSGAVPRAVAPLIACRAARPRLAQSLALAAKAGPSRSYVVAPAAQARALPRPATRDTFFPNLSPRSTGRHPLNLHAVGLGPAAAIPQHARRAFSATSLARKQAGTPPPGKSEPPEARKEESERDEEESGFEKSERAAKAAQINLSARLSKEGKGQGKQRSDEIWRLIKIARPEVRWLALAVGFLAVSSCVTLSLPYVVGKVLDMVTNGGGEDPRIFGLTLTQFFFALGGFLTLGAAANFARIILLRIIGERVVARLRSSLFRRTYVQDAEFYDANRVGDLISRLGTDCVIVAKSITQNISDGLRALFAGTAAFSAMVWLSPHLSAILIVIGPPVAFGGYLYGRAIRNISRSIQKNVGTLSKIGEERLGNVRTSQAFVGEVQEVARYNHQVKKIFNLGLRESKIFATFFASTGWVGNMAILAMLVVGGDLVRTGALSVGNLTSFMMYTAFAGSSVSSLTSFFSELMKGVGAASRLFELQDRTPTISQTKGAKVKSARGTIKFEDVRFAYPTRPAVNIFNGVNFEIPSGSNVCVVGPSGGGKSTVTSLLLRFYNPTSGTITINGTDVTKMNVKSLRRRIGVVSQEPVLFSGTIADNIAYAKPKATRFEIVTAARKANCTFISDLPEGLETQVGARGSQLSGGQKQRIAIARALIKNPDILILDEATSALDAESETLVNAALVSLLRGNNTTISIAHRLSTIKRSDQIIVLNGEGRVAEIGSYAQLSADPASAFSRLMEWQMTGAETSSDPRRMAMGRITEAEEIEQDLKEEANEDGDDADAEAEGEAEGVEVDQPKQTPGKTVLR